MNETDDLSDVPMLELFRVETENQTAVLTGGLLALERGERGAEQLETLMRAAHSIKGAARIVNLQTVVKLAHAMEDCLVAAQRGSLQLRHAEIDLLLRGVDLLQHLSKCSESNLTPWENAHASELQQVLDALSKLIPTSRPGVPPAPQPDGSESSAQAVALKEVEPQERVLRLAAENLNRLLALAGESLVESRWLGPFAASLQRLKRHQGELSEKLESLHRLVDTSAFSGHAENHFRDLFRKLGECQQFLGERMEELDLFDRRSAHLSHRLYLEVLRTRMRPFSDGVSRFPRMVRDLARMLGKNVRLEISGENTPVDRDILERLETPLAHLLRNAVDHGCEPSNLRHRAGKPPEALIHLEARHRAGMLLVTVSDDGAGLDPERLRQAVIRKKLTMPAIADKLSETELLEFLFLPGFSLKETVTEISGRGVGLDIVHNMVKSVSGSVRLSTQPGRGMRFQLHLPLTLSVVRTLLVEIAGEPYALPLAQIARTLKLPEAQIETVEGRRHFRLGQHSIGLLKAQEIFDCPDVRQSPTDLPVVVLADRNTHYGLIVDRFLGERELVVQPLDGRLGKIKDISAAALMEDGSPVLVVDVEDLIRSIEKLIEEPPRAGTPNPLQAAPGPRKRILAVDDSLTVRELERKLLANHGYQIDVAVDGADGWNAVRTRRYDLVITDVDMPRLDGIELTTLIKKDPRLQSIPVMIVSYKDREADRLRGLQAGANYYLAKGSFNDETFLEAVAELIGEPR